MQSSRVWGRFSRVELRRQVTMCYATHAMLCETSTVVQHLDMKDTSGACSIPTVVCGRSPLKELVSSAALVQVGWRPSEKEEVSELGLVPFEGKRLEEQSTEGHLRHFSIGPLSIGMTGPMTRDVYQRSSVVLSAACSEARTPFLLRFPRRPALGGCRGQKQKRTASALASKWSSS